MQAEGWYQDPFGVHADRWFSQGRPTALVRDDGQEANDPPPVPDYSGPLADIVVEEPTGGSDLLRADDPSSKPFDVGDGVDAVIDRAIFINSGIFGRAATKNLP